jgi:hypothetical protein
MPRSVIQVAAYVPKDTSAASGSVQSPDRTSACFSASQSSASRLVRKVCGAGRSVPFGAR